jgi:hypothetical protein
LKQAEIGGDLVKIKLILFIAALTSLLALLIIFGYSLLNTHQVEKEVREAVWHYIDNQPMGEMYSKEDWENATIVREIVTPFYALDESYEGKEIFIVSIKNAIASPHILVNPDNHEVIGVIPGD